MRIDPLERSIVAALQQGLPLVVRPFRMLAEAHRLEEHALIGRLTQMIKSGVVKRFGVVVDHRSLGFTANAMVVWDVPDEYVSDVAHRLCRYPDVTLCYRRPRRLPVWPYNLFCMIHGRSRSAVLGVIENIGEREALQTFPRQVLFSRRRFKQRGAQYVTAGERPTVSSAPAA